MKISKNYLKPLLVGLVVSVIASFLYLIGVLGSWSNRSTDKFFLARASDSRITIVAIDDSSITQLGRWPWQRKIHADLIKKLSAAGARVIAYDVNFPEVSDEENDRALEEAIKSAGNVILPIELKLHSKNKNFIFDGEEVLAPISRLSYAAASTGHTNTPPDTDGIVRRLPLYVESVKAGEPFIPSFAGEALKLAVGHDRAIFSAPKDSSGSVAINFPNVPFKSFRTISAIDIIRDRADLSSIKDGVVFVGATAPNLHDAYIVPTSEGIPMPGVEIHASIFDTVAGSHWLINMPAWSVFLEIILLGLLTSLLIIFLRARINLPLTVALWIIQIITAFILFDRGLILDIVWPTITIIFVYAAVTLERRISSDRERRALRTAFSRYVSETVVEAILKDPSKLKLGGMRKRMSVLFSDIRGFTNISEGLKPEELVLILNRYLNRMTDLVFAHEGVLDKYIGDAVMAFWNAPFDQNDHAARALRTAIAMRDVLAEMNRVKVFGELTLKIGIGVNTGDMVVGNVGGETRFDYTVIGDNVNMASRLESLTKEYGVGILTTQSTKDDLKDIVLVRRLDKVAVKGKNEPVIIYEAMELASKASNDQKNLVREFETALELYFAKDFSGAIAKCVELLGKYPNDGPSQTLLNRSSHFSEEPPPADWDGTWVYTKK